jgi:hypothetical protein
MTGMNSLWQLLFLRARPGSKLPGVRRPRHAAESPVSPFAPLCVLCVPNHRVVIPLRWKVNQFKWLEYAR